MNDTALPETPFVLDPGGWRGPLGRFLYITIRFCFWCGFKILWRTRARGMENIPPKGPLLFAGNHASFVDPPLLGSHVPQPIYYMAKEELFETPLMGPLLPFLNAFPVRRKEGDVGAIRTATRILNAGGCMVIFPEGRRQKNGVLGRGRGGVGLLARATGARVVPTYLNNTHRAWRFPKFDVVFGAPLAMEPEETNDAFAQRVMGAIQQLKESFHGSKS